MAVASTFHMDILFYIAYFAIGLVFASWMGVGSSKNYYDNVAFMLAVFGWPVMLVLGLITWPISSAYEAITGRNSDTFIAVLIIASFIGLGIYMW